MKTKRQHEYWYCYEFETFGDTSIYKTPPHFSQEDFGEYSGHYYGPFLTQSAARQELLKRLRSDLVEIRGMIRTAREPAKLWSQS